MHASSVDLSVLLAGIPAGAAVEVGSNFFLFFKSGMSSHGM